MPLEDSRVAKGWVRIGLLGFDLPGIVDHRRNVLGDTRFDACVARGAAIEIANKARYARQQIQLLRSELAVPS